MSQGLWCYYLHPLPLTAFVNSLIHIKRNLCLIIFTVPNLHLIVVWKCLIMFTVPNLHSILVWKETWYCIRPWSLTQYSYHKPQVLDECHELLMVFIFVIWFTFNREVTECMSGMRLEGDRDNALQASKSLITRRRVKNLTPRYEFSTWKNCLKVP